MAGHQARPSCVALEKDFRKLMNHKIGDSILGKVMHEFCEPYEQLLDIFLDMFWNCYWF